MTWTEVPSVPLAASKKADEPVTASITPAGGRYRQRFMLVVRPALVADGLSWWKVGAFVSVHVGAGEHAGMLRVTPGGPHRLVAPGGIPGKRGPAAMLTLFTLPGMPPAGHKPVPADHEYGDGWLELMLPGWARSEARSAKPVPPETSAASRPSGPPSKAPEAAPAAPPYLPITQRVPDPAVHLGRATGGPIPELGRPGRKAAR